MSATSPWNNPEAVAEAASLEAPALSPLAKETVAMAETFERAAKRLRDASAMSGSLCKIHVMMAIEDHGHEMHKHYGRILAGSRERIEAILNDRTNGKS